MLRNTRTTLVAALVVALSALVFASGAGAQRGGASRQANTNAGAGQKKRVFVGRGSETSKGSRVTITADDSLKDYRAYRSGDRFYVELPKSAAGSGLRGSGKGYTDMQVEQRGDSVVVSYRVQPGAKSRVEQRFNRLEVVFDVPEGGAQPQQQQQQATASNQASRNQPPPAAETRNQTPAQQPAAQTPANTSPNNAAERAAAERAAEAARAQQAASNAAPAVTTPPVTTAVPPANVPDPNAQPGATPATAPAQEGAAPAGVPADPQLAQAQPPASTAPVSITKPATAANPSGASLGAFLLRNWALTLILALVVVGLGLVIAARRTTAATRETDGGADADATLVAAEPRAARAKEATAKALRQASVTTEASVPTKASVPVKTSVPLEASTSAEASVPVVTPVPVEASAPAQVATPDAAEAAAVELKPLADATALAGVAAASRSRKQSRKDARQGAKKKKKGARADDTVAEEPLTVAPAAGEQAVEESVVEETALAESVVEETVVEEPVVEESAIEESAIEEAFVGTPAVEEQAVEEAGAEEVEPAEQTLEAPAFFESPVEEVAEVSAAPEAVEEPEVAAPETSLAAYEEATVETEAAPATTEIIPVTSEVPEPEVSEPEAVEAEAPAAFAEIVPAVAPEPERVQDETRTLLEGGGYDRSVIGTLDPFSRQMIAAELLSALAGRNQQRRERAGAAFVELGYFDETARDLHGADAPAERAAAARSLALLGDRVATPHLVAALEDQNLDVRRAAVEALGSLRDPSAVEALEALLERERNERNRIPPRVIRVAADACREGAEEIAPAPQPSAETAQAPETAIEPAPAAEVELSEFEVEPRAAAATFETDSSAIAAFEPEATEEVTAHAEESPVSIAPFVGEPESILETEPAVETPAGSANAIEPVFAEDERADEDEVTLVAEAPEPEPRVDSFVADLTEELNAASETQTFETPVAEPRAVADTDIQPFVETDEYAVEVSQPAAESARATLFNEGEAEEVTREVAPFRPAASAEPAAPVAEVDAGAWFDFDMRELSETPRPAAEEPAAAPPPASEHVFEFSSGETFTSYPETGATGAGTTPAAAPPSFADARAELTRDVEAFGARAPERETAAPAASSSSAEKGVAPFDEFSTVPASIQQRLASRDANERAAAIVELSRVDTDEAFHQICAAFDDDSKEVRGAAARALYGLRTDRAESFTRALREASPERRRQIGAAISSSGLAGESISQLTGESRERTYEAFSLLFLMAKAGEVQPLVRAIEGHPSNEVRLAVVKLLALSGQKEILPAFRRLAVRGSLPTEVRSAVMEAIYQISSSQPTPA
ncbi:MAG TPA: HEAT repeat domain-containing protein [Pyrinomonadaceae bacterium]|jgi:hypothetical protein